jgi:hypothetical protein
MVKFLEIAEKKDVPDAIKKVLDADFFNWLNCDNPPPILLQETNDGALGQCLRISDTSQGEICIDPVLLLLPDQFKSVYIHELTHRLLANEFGHRAEFFCLNLCLHIRADIGDMVKFYDIQDEKVEMLPAIFALVLPLAQQLATSNLTAEKCAKIIIEKINSNAINEKHNEPQNLRNQIADIHKAVDDAKLIAYQNYGLLALIGVVAWIVK